MKNLNDLKTEFSKKNKVVFVLIGLFFYQNNLIAQLRQGAFFTPEQGKVESQKQQELYSSKKEWQKRAKAIKKGIIEGAEISSIKPNQKIEATIHSKKTNDGYTVENVFFESLPGLFVSGNLYKPLNISGKIPAVLAPHGHGKDPRFGEATQTRCAIMARMGAVVFAYDMIGYGDMQQCDHKIETALKLQIINSIRSMDFLSQLSEVDKNKIAVSGESGGGTQTFILAALDPRVAVSVPVVMVSNYFYGGCTCESGMPIHVRTDHATSNVEIAACFAPKPLLLVSDGDDWTKFTPEVEYPHIQRIYSFFDAFDMVENVHLPNEKHDYGPSKRAAAYAFLGKYLNLDTNQIDESKITLLSKEDLSVFTSENPLPSNALKGNEAILSLLKTIK
ncbi:acetylxylan esterase [Lacihabitans sp. LS3-19]|uniref:alpha/beta hydrolase family protein n=1 Tax=Lacihabitans sp. LS3-19 TaxID=2487335 RepID=UPI0020CE8867|nr:acetylxylan esterase [Lacihabitans sp. LS3-19]MCP9770226.1 acetylxylan esterase [Lacihabitans sp. LS3-19]